MKDDRNDRSQPEVATRGLLLFPQSPFTIPIEHRIQQRSKGHARVGSRLMFDQDANEQRCFDTASAPWNAKQQVRLAPAPVFREKLAIQQFDTREIEILCDLRNCIEQEFAQVIDLLECLSNAAIGEVEGELVSSGHRKTPRQWDRAASSLVQHCSSSLSASESIGEPTALRVARDAQSLNRASCNSPSRLLLSQHQEDVQLPLIFDRLSLITTIAISLKFSGVGIDAVHSTFNPPHVALGRTISPKCFEALN